jgi:hypothetical protein
MPGPRMSGRPASRPAASAGFSTRVAMTKKKKNPLTPAEKQARRHQQNADKKNARLREEIPLFVDQVPVETAEGERWHWRRNIANGIEHLHMRHGYHFLTLLHLILIRRFAREAIAPEMYAKLDGYCRRTFPCRYTYDYGFWKRVLTGEKIEFRMEVIADRKPGEPCMRCVEWYAQRHMTSEEFYQRWPVDPLGDAVDIDGQGGAMVAELDAAFARLLKLQGCATDAKS